MRLLCCRIICASTSIAPHLCRDIDADTHIDTHTHTQKPTHCLNSLDLTLHTEHLTHNSHSDFIRDDKCFRATRRLDCLFLGGGLTWIGTPSGCDVVQHT